jgi:YbbR domain-containing protein
LDDAQPGEHVVDLGPDIVHAPLGVEVLSVDPPRLTLSLERRAERKVPVKARFRGRPSPPYETDGYTVIPAQVTVQGPERIVRQVQEAVTEEVDLTGRRGSFEAVVAIQPDRGGVRILDKPVALVKVSLQAAPATRTLEGVRLVPDPAPSSARGARFEPGTVSVVLEGPAAALSRLSASDVQAVLDLEGMAPRSAPYAVEPRVEIAPGMASGVTVRSVSPSTVQVTISRGVAP